MFFDARFCCRLARIIFGEREWLSKRESATIEDDH